MGWLGRRGWLVALCVNAACTGDDAVGMRYPAPSAANVKASVGGSSAQSAGGAGVPSFNNASSNATGRSGLPPKPTDAGLPHTMFMPRADLDPDASFDWTETTQGATSCQAGVYSGMFDCQFTPDTMGSGIDVGTYDVTGPIVLTLMQSMNGEFLEITQGSLEASTNDIFGLQAMLKGQLDCQTLKLSATGADGKWAIGDPSNPILPGGDFGLMLEGDYDPAKQELTGTWNIDSSTVPGTCVGTWTADFMP